MKKTGFLLLVVALATAAAQQTTNPTTPMGQVPSSLKGSAQPAEPPPPPQANVQSTNLVEAANKPSITDINCDGFIASTPLVATGVVRAGWDTPDQSRYATPNYVFIKGAGFQEGGEYFIVRKLHDPNRFQAFKGQYKKVGALGTMYEDIARVQLIPDGIRGKYAITKVISSCETITPGDYAIPYADRPDPEFRYTGTIDPFVRPNGKLTGMIVLSKDFDQYIGTDHIVYLNVGSNSGVKPGDYFHVTREYESLIHDPGDSISFKATEIEDTQSNRVPFPPGELKELPRRVLANLMILSTTPKTSAGLITDSLETVRVGDGVELFEPPPPPPPPPPPASTLPTISCAAVPDTVNRGESSTITCLAASPDNHPISVSFATTAGAVTPHDNNAVLDTAQVQAPAAVTVTGTVTDDRNQSASSTATVNVQPAAAPPAPSAQQIQFRPRSSYVDNRAKAILDGVALQLQQQADATAVVIGRSDKGESKALAQRRADNVKKYLTASKGIDPKRIDAHTSPTPGKLAEVWVLSAGASLPADAGNTPAPAAAPAAPAAHHHAHKKAKATAPVAK
jgi:outer membrane protein OmpA-like peptidoglycan-associated protein